MENVMYIQKDWLLTSDVFSCNAIPKQKDICISREIQSFFPHITGNSGQFKFILK